MHKSEEHPDSSRSLEEEVLAELLEVRGDLNHYIYSSIPNRSDAEDVLQEVCLKIWKSKEHYQTGTNFRAWAFTIARYTILDFRKRHATGRVLFLDAETVRTLADEMVKTGADPSSRHVYSDALAACVALLGERLSRMLKLHYKDGFSLADLAKRERVSETSLKQLLYRARIKVRDCVKLKLDATT